MKNKNKILINIISYTFLGFMFYLFIGDINILDIFQVFIFSIISFALSLFIRDNFKLSNNKIIKILQKFVFINCILALIGLILYLFDVNIFNTIFCSGTNDLESGLENIKKILNGEINPILVPFPCSLLATPFFILR
jgi:hypothetical protein